MICYMMGELRLSNRPRIEFYGGIGTIGGTKVVVREGEHRVIFDFGLSYAPGGDFWGGRIHPRSGTAGVCDQVALGYIPVLDGIYHADDAAALGVQPGRGEKTQVFISHLHLDHMAVAHLLADEVPVWMHADSLRLYRAVATTGERPPVPGGARGFEWGQTIEVGPIKVTPVPVDHDIPGAGALLIETSVGTVVYTGDLRLHGEHPERVHRFMERAAAMEPKMLLIEGTRLGEAERSPDRPPSLGEAGVAPKVADMAKQATGLALITLYPRNTERITNIVAALRGTGRTLALSAETAYIWASMGGDLSQVSIYKRHKDALALANGEAPEWLSNLFAKAASVIDAATVSENQQAYVLQLFYWDINELVDIQPNAGSIFIHSNGEPLGRFDPAFDLFVRWLNHFGIELLFAASTGHATAEDLQKVVEGIRPEVLMPIHSHRPELLEVAGIRRVLPELGGIYDIATGEKIG